MGRFQAEKTIIDQATFNKAENKRIQGQGESDPFKIEKVERKEDTLAIVVSYTGGCKDHSFDVIWNGQVVLSYPLVVNLILVHHANGDPCEARITETLKIDLKEMFGNDDYSKQKYVFNVFSILNRTGDPDAFVVVPPVSGENLPDPEPVSAMAIQSAKVSGRAISIVVRCVVPEPCWAFTRTEHSRSNNNFAVTVFARRVTNDPCLQVLSSIDASFDVIAEAPGSYSFQFWRSDGTTVDTTLIVQ